jgi:uncharacterized protein (DUF885 family)
VPPRETSLAISVDARVLALADEVVAELFETRPGMVAMLRPPGARYDALPDDSLAGVAARRRTNEARAATLRGIERTSLTSEETRIAYGLALTWAERNVALAVCRPELWRVSQIYGWQVNYADMAAAQPVGTPELRAQALARYAKLPRYVDDQIAALRKPRGRLSAPSSTTSYGRSTRCRRGARGSPYASPGLRDDDAAFAQSPGARARR